MKSNTARVLLGIAVVAVAVVLLLVLKDDSDDGSSTSATNGSAATRPAGSGKPGSGEKPSQPAVPTIVVKNGKPVGGIAELTFEEGERVRFRVTSNADDEIHVHGYDVEEPVAPGKPANFDFPATIEGLFEGELHHSEEQILELRVNP